MAKERLDVLLVNRGLAVSREKAKAVIMSGCVYVDGQKEDKAGTTFPEDARRSRLPGKHLEIHPRTSVRMRVPGL